MRVITWSLRLIIFFLFASFSAMNSENITLYYFEDRSIEMPLSVVLLVFFALGVFLTIFTTPPCSAGKR
jgi:lipopolysaccharide assembly protein A